MKKLWAWILIVFMITGSCIPVNAADINGTPDIAVTEETSASEKEGDVLQKDPVASGEANQQDAAEPEQTENKESTAGQSDPEQGSENVTDEPADPDQKDRDEKKNPNQEELQQGNYMAVPAVESDMVDGSEKITYKLMVDPSEITLKEGESFKLSYFFSGKMKYSRMGLQDITLQSEVQMLYLSMKKR